jgi:hypothetical protein
MLLNITVVNRALCLSRLTSFVVQKTLQAVVILLWHVKICLLTGADLQVSTALVLSTDRVPTKAQELLETIVQGLRRVPLKLVHVPTIVILPLPNSHGPNRS